MLVQFLWACWASGPLGERDAQSSFGLKEFCRSPWLKADMKHAHLWGSLNKQKQQLQNLLIPQREKLFFLHTSCVQCRITKQRCTIIREGEGMIVARVSKLPPALLSGLEPRTLRLSDRGAASLLHQSALKTDPTLTNPTNAHEQSVIQRGLKTHQVPLNVTSSVSCRQQSY